MRRWWLRRQYQTRDVSAAITQDVLLCTGAEDHYVPLHQLYDQASWLIVARSLTTRLFTLFEQALNHCQIGNLPLAIHTIGTWIDTLSATPASAQAANAGGACRGLDGDVAARCQRAVHDGDGLEDAVRGTRLAHHPEKRLPVFRQIMRQQ